MPFPVLSPFGPTGRQGGEGWGTPAFLPSLNPWSTVVCFPAFSLGTQFGFLSLTSNSRTSTLPLKTAQVFGGGHSHAAGDGFPHLLQGKLATFSPCYDGILTLFFLGGKKKLFE